VKTEKENNNHNNNINNEIETEKNNYNYNLSNINKKEFNDLADLLNIKSSNENSSDLNSYENFKIDLFLNKIRKFGLVENKNNEEEIIEIERDDNKKIKDMKHAFDDFGLLEDKTKNNNNNQNENENDDLDLLDLMDMASK
jgi:hypothetical protein